MNILERLRQEFPGEDIQLFEEVDPQGKYTKARTLIVNGKTITISASGDDSDTQLLHEVMAEDANYTAVREQTRILLRG